MGIKVTSKIGPRPELELPIKCPKCGTQAAKLKMRDTAPGTVIECSCGAKITLTGDDVRQMQEAMDRLYDSLKKLGRPR
jgi:hypothetical protein